jgi:hypothetical protein
MKRVTDKLQRHPAPGGSDNPQDLVRVRPGVTGHQRVTEQEPRRLPSPGQGIPDGRGFRRRRPPRRRSQEQRRRAATAASLCCTLHGWRASGSASLRRAAVTLRRGAGTSRKRSMAGGAGRDEDGARHDYQAGDPGHAMTINAGPRADKDPVPVSSSAAGRAPNCGLARSRPRLAHRPGPPGHHRAPRRAGTGRPGPDPDSNTHPASVRPGTPVGGRFRPGKETCPMIRTRITAGQSPTMTG